MRLVFCVMFCLGVSGAALAKDNPQKFFTDGSSVLDARAAVMKAAKGEVVYQCTQKELSDKGTLVNKKVK